MILFTLGEVLAVFIVDDGEPLESATHYRRTVAGSEANVAAGVVRLGHDARIVTTLGDDGLGDAVQLTLTAWDIDARVSRSSLPTGVLVRTPAPGVPAKAIHLRSASAATELNSAQVDAAWTDDIAVVFLTGISAVRSPSAQGAVERAAELAHESGALVVVDPNFRVALGTRAEFARALEHVRDKCDVAIGDLDELATLAGSSPEEAVRTLLEAGCRYVVTKLGEAGVEATDGAHTVRTPSFAKSVVDTVGAGDSFAAGFIVAVIEGRDLLDCLRWGSAVAAQVVAAVGDVEGLPSRSSLERQLQGDT